MIIRKMMTDDVDRVHELGCACRHFHVSEKMSCFWPKVTLRRWCGSQSDITLVAEQDGEIKGFILMACHPATGKATLENLFVLATSRRQGIARRLIDSAITVLKQRGYFMVIALAQFENQIIATTLRSHDFHAGRHCVWFDRVL